LIDNSISADATNVQIFCDTGRSIPVVAILDDGHGMDGEQLIAALRHGSSNPKKKRGAKDLGRFGLGLKTASFSQCKKLTVVSSIDGVRVGAEWDLSAVEDLDDWFISILESDEIQTLPYVDSLPDTGGEILIVSPRTSPGASVTRSSMRSWQWWRGILH
jgi:hypothetical protein